MTLREKIEALLVLEKEARAELGTRKRVKWLDWTVEIQDFSPHLLLALLAAIELEDAREAHWVAGESGSTQRLANAINGFQAAVAEAEVITRGDQSGRKS